MVFYAVLQYTLCQIFFSSNVCWYFYDPPSPLNEIVEGLLWRNNLITTRQTVAATCNKPQNIWFAYDDLIIKVSFLNDVLK